MNRSWANAILSLPKSRLRCGLSRMQLYLAPINICYMFFSTHDIWFQSCQCFPMRWLTAQAPPKAKAKSAAAPRPAPEAGVPIVKKEWIWSLGCGDWIGPFEITFWGMAHRSQSQQKLYIVGNWVMIAMHTILWTNHEDNIEFIFKFICFLIMYFFLGIWMRLHGNIQTSLAMHRGEPARRESRKNINFILWLLCFGVRFWNLPKSGSFGIQADAGRTKNAHVARIYGHDMGAPPPKKLSNIVFESLKINLSCGMLDALPEPGLLGGSSQTGSGL